MIWILEYVKGFFIYYRDSRRRPSIRPDKSSAVVCALLRLRLTECSPVVTVGDRGVCLVWCLSFTWQVSWPSHCEDVVLRPRSGSILRPEIAVLVLVVWSWQVILVWYILFYLWTWSFVIASYFAWWSCATWNILDQSLKAVKILLTNTTVPVHRFSEGADKVWNRQFWSQSWYRVLGLGLEILVLFPSLSHWSPYS